MNNIMKKLLKIELERALKNKWFYICLLIGLVFVGKDIYSVVYYTRKVTIYILIWHGISFRELIANGGD